MEPEPDAYGELGLGPIEQPSGSSALAGRRAHQWTSCGVNFSCPDRLDSEIVAKRGFFPQFFTGRNVAVCHRLCDAVQRCVLRGGRNHGAGLALPFTLELR